MKNFLNLTLAFIFLCASNAPVFAQAIIKTNKANNFNPNSSVDFLNNITKEAQKNQNPFDRLPPIFDKKYPQAVIAKTMKTYNATVEDYRNHPAAKFTPSEVLENMKYETKKMAYLLAKNPRYQKEVNKRQWMDTGMACVNGIAMGALLVLCAPAAGLYGGAGAGAWFGATATSTTLAASYATVSLGRTLFVVAMLEMFTILGQELMDNVYANLTKRLLKYRYLENNANGHAVVNSAAEGSILNENVTQLMNGGTCINKSKDDSKPHFSNRWVDKEAQREALIRLAGLQAINANLQFSSEKTKYDMALLDILSLFTDAPVQFDEKVFTREVVAEGEIKVVKNSDTVDLNPGRLLPRSPALRKALNAIQTM
jgi:hypothetical protein